MRTSFRKACRSYSLLWIMGYFLANRTCLLCSWEENNSLCHQCYGIISFLQVLETNRVYSYHIHRLISWEATLYSLRKDCLTILQCSVFARFGVSSSVSSCNVTVIFSSFLWATNLKIFYFVTHLETPQKTTRRPDDPHYQFNNCTVISFLTLFQLKYTHVNSITCKIYFVEKVFFGHKYNLRLGYS